MGKIVIFHHFNIGAIQISLGLMMVYGYELTIHN